jgi:hypothetical protein
MFLMSQTDTCFRSPDWRDGRLAFSCWWLLYFSLPLSAFAQECSSSSQEAFAGFFSEFVSDKAFAVGRTIYPLSVVHWHHGMDGHDVAPPRRSTREREQDQALPRLSAFMQENSLDANILDVGSRAAIVEVAKEGTSWVMTYHFLRKGGCWFLRELQDHSSSNFR